MNLRRDTDTFKSNLFKEIVAQLADPSITRKKALSMVHNIHKLHVTVLKSLMQHQIDKQIIDNESREALDTLCDDNLVQSEYKIVQSLISRNVWVNINPYILDSHHKEDRRMEEHAVLKKVLHVMQLVDLTDFFSKLFGLPNFLNDMFKFIDNLTDDGISIENIMQSKYWKYRKSKILLNDDEIALPLFIYNDDFEPLNALGSHRGAYKLSGVYVYLPCLPPSVQSKLEYIFLGMLFYAYDRSIYGNTRIFTPFIDQLNQLQNVGIPVNHPRCKKIRLIPMLLIGDNLGLNGIMGFVECFSANYFCRLCRSFRSKMLTNSTEDVTMLRNEFNYLIQSGMMDSSKTGIKERSVWNNVHHFHVTQNRCVDIMHDLFEGVCHIILCEMLKNFINVRKLFTLTQFNLRLRAHNFGPLVSNSNISNVTAEMLEKQKLLTSASEMLALFLHFPFIVGDLVDDELPEWQVYSLLRQIIEIVQQKKIHKDTHILLRTLITEHHQLFQTTFNTLLSPKLHFMVHYPRIMKFIGPLCFVSSMRFESFHSIFKNIIKNNKNRINISKSCAFKIQMRYANLFLNFQSIKSSKIVTTKKTKVASVDLLREFHCSLPLPEFVFITRNVEIHSLAYRNNIVIQDKIEKDGTPTFALIKKIFIVNEEILLGCQRLINLGFVEHYFAYKVDFDNFFYIKSIDENKLNYKLSYIFYGTSNRNFVMWN